MASFLPTAIAAAREAGTVIRGHIGQSLQINDATGHDIKLALDEECEALIRAMIERAYPAHAILGEEEGGVIAADVPTWIIDPLDGTVNFAHGLPYFSVSIAVSAGGETVAGVVYDPLRDELFRAERGAGAFLNDRPIRVSQTRDRAQAMVCMGFPKTDENIDSVLGELRELAHQVKKVRILGSAALDLSNVAAGRLDAFAEYGLRTWDIAAGELLIREAGGRCRRVAAGEHTWNLHADNGFVFE